MLATRVLRHRQPMIRFLGKRTSPSKTDHTPHAHPASPEGSLPGSFAEYREREIQHGPLRGQQQQSKSSSPSSSSGSGSATAPITPYGAIGGHSAQELGPIRPGKGEVLDRNELPVRFRRTTWSVQEIEAVESGGASLFA